MKNLKRIIETILFTIIITGLIGSNFSYGENNYNEKLEQAIIKVKNNLNISDKYNVFDSRINTHDKETNFYMNWSYSQEKLGYININTDIDGNIIEFYKYIPNQQEGKSIKAKITREEGLEKALEFISKIDKDISKEIRVIEDSSPMNPQESKYYYEFTRYINETPFPGNNISITIDKYSKEVVEYYVNWNRNLSFLSTDKIINMEKARESYKNNIGLVPMYKSSNRGYERSNDNSKDNYYIAYSPLQPWKAIDAVTGKPVNRTLNRVYAISGNMDMIKEKMDIGLTPEEQTSVDNLVGLLEIATVEEKSRAILKIDETYKMKNSYLGSDYKNPGDYIWSLSFIKNIDKNKEHSIEISLDAKTGQLIRFYKYKPYDEYGKIKINKSEALEIAKTYLKEINPDKINQIEYISNDDEINENPIYSFQFIRKIDGIYVEEDMISIEVDRSSGEIRSYNLSWYKGNFPSSENMISLDKAYETLWDKVGYELIYIDDFNLAESEEENPIATLIYSIKGDKPAIISATTGEILGHNGKPYKEKRIVIYKDIEKSYAKDKIRVLAEHGISFLDDEFKPKEKIKQRDFLCLLWKSINPYRMENISIDNIYDEFIKNGYILEKEKNQDKIVTKEEATKFIIKVMKLDRVAEIDGIYKDIFKDEKDISKDLKGYINLGYGLKIISGDGSGNIKPKQELKREDAANMIYNYLFN